jgi:cytochrome c553
MRFVPFAIVLACLVARHGVAADTTPEQAQFFEAKVRPLLVAKCQDCHGEDEANANLRLDSLGTILGGGDSGPALVAGKPDESLLVKAISYANPHLQMPPDGKLADAEIATLKEWIKLGAPWPGADPAAAPQTPRKEFKITDEDRAWWAFQPIRSAELGTRNAERETANASQLRVPSSQLRANSVDAFILEKLQAKGIASNPPAGKRELIRRATFDLTGLPPTAEEVDAFVADESPDAYSRLVDLLLASPHYGEHWGRHWLDVVRFAQTNGYEYDADKPEAWRYRDYVVQAFNEDKPYDRFLREQLAGDELLERGTGSAERGADKDVPSSELRTPRSFNPLIATGFYRLGLWDFEPDDARMSEFDELDDMVTTTAQAMLGLTINCARCHDHKFDPISQADYYRFLAFFRNIRRYGHTMSAPQYTSESSSLTPLTTPAEAAKWFAEKEYAVAELTAAIDAAANTETRTKFVNLRGEVERNSKPLSWALVVREHGATAPPTHILTRGSAATPTTEVSPAFPEVLAPQPVVIPAPAPGAQTTGRRSVLADWIASAQNPLSARVMVNRIWQHHFGRGIVETTNDFGRTGVPPTHPELLDWLAGEFIRSGWSVKHMHRLIMASSTYQQASGTDNPTALAADEGNRLWWRQNLRRLRAESLRDAMLAASGQLNLAVGGPSFYPTLPKEVLFTSTNPGRGWGQSTPEEQRRRSLYIFVKRTLLVPLMETFDYTNTTFPMGERATTTVAPQALMMLNNTFVHEQAAALAERVKREAGEAGPDQVARLFQIVLQRLPTDKERDIALSVLANQQQARLATLALESGTRDPQSDAATANHRALRSLCLMMLNLNEFLYID